MARRKTKSRSKVNEAGNYTKPSMRKRLFQRIKAGGKGGAPGQWSARKAQMLAKQYKAKGGGYRNWWKNLKSHLKNGQMKNGDMSLKKTQRNQNQSITYSCKRSKNNDGIARKSKYYSLLYIICREWLFAYCHGICFQGWYVPGKSFFYHLSYFDLLYFCNI